MQPPSQNEVKEMDNLLSALSDIDEGKPVKSNPVHNQYQTENMQGSKTKKYVPYVDTRAEDEARATSEMNSLLESLSDIVDDYKPSQPEIHQPDYSSAAHEYNSQYGFDDDNSYNPYEEQRRLDELSSKMANGTFVEPVVEYNTQTKQVSVKKSGKTWDIVEENVQGLKNAKKYKIVNTYDNSVLLDNIMMYESAYALHAVLNKGQSLTNPKILGVISMGLQYTSAVTEMIKYARERQKVLNESNYPRAQEIDSILSEKKAYANNLKKDVISFLRSEGFIK